MLKKVVLTLFAVLCMILILSYMINIYTNRNLKFIEEYAKHLKYFYNTGKDDFILKYSSDKVLEKLGYKEDNKENNTVNSSVYDDSGVYDIENADELNNDTMENAENTANEVAVQLVEVLYDKGRNVYILKYDKGYRFYIFLKYDGRKVIDIE